MRRAVAVVGLAVLVCGAGAGAYLAGRGGIAAVAGPAAPTTKRVPVERRTLVATQPVSGRVGASQSWTIGLPDGSTPAEVAAAGDAVATAGDQVDVAGAALLAAERTRSLSLLRDSRAVSAAPAGAPRRDARLAMQLDRVGLDSGVRQARAGVTEARRGLVAARRGQAARRESEMTSARTVTGLAAAGTTVRQGQDLFELDGQGTVLLLGSTPAYRALREGDDGPDVAELQANLIALGLGGTPPITASGTFDRPTTDAVKRWQASRHLVADGVVRLGSVVVLPAPVRVTAVHVAVGSAAQPGSPVIDVASTVEVVTLDVNPALALRIQPGDPIRFDVTDGPAVPGTIASVGAPTTETADQGGGPQGGLVVPVVAAPTDPAALAALDGATVSADITVGTAPDVLAVPVSALVVLADGSFGIEVAAAGSTHFVSVQPGIYDQAMVEIEADGVAPGDLVVVPGT